MPPTPTSCDDDCREIAPVDLRQTQGGWSFDQVIVWSLACLWFLQTPRPRSICPPLYSTAHSIRNFYLCRTTGATLTNIFNRRKRLYILRASKPTATGCSYSSPPSSSSCSGMGSASCHEIDDLLRWDSTRKRLQLHWFLVVVFSCHRNITAAPARVQQTPWIPNVHAALWLHLVLVIDSTTYNLHPGPRHLLTHFGSPGCRQDFLWHRNFCIP